MRTLTAALAALLSLLLVAAALPAVWVDRNFIQEDGFAALAAPLGSNPAFQSALSTAAAQAVVSKLGLQGGLAQVVEPLVDRAASSLSQDPGFPGAWTETLRRSHRLTLSDPSDATRPLSLDLGPFLALLAAKIPAVFGVPVDAAQPVPLPLGHQDQRQVLIRVAQLSPGGYGAATVAAALFALAVLAARRRSTTVLLFGIGLLVIAAAEKIALSFAVRAVGQDDGGGEVAGAFKGQLVHLAVDSFTGWLGAVAIAGIVLVVAGGLGRFFARS